MFPCRGGFQGTGWAWGWGLGGGESRVRLSGAVGSARGTPHPCLPRDAQPVWLTGSPRRRLPSSRRWPRVRCSEAHAASSERGPGSSVAVRVCPLPNGRFMNAYPLGGGTQHHRTRKPPPPADPTPTTRVCSGGSDSPLASPQTGPEMGLAC